MKSHVERFVVPFMFGIYLLLGILVHADYGVSWDEPISRSNGMINLKYVESIIAPQLLTDDVKSLPNLAEWRDKDYGVAFELPLAMLEKAFGVSGENPYAFRHLLTFLFSALGVVALYKTSTFLYRDYRLGVLAALMLIFSPRFFAESFYNSKDIVFMAATAVAIYTMTRFITTPRLSWAVLHGLACAYAIDVRIMGVATVVVTVGLLGARVIRKEVSGRQFLVYMAAYAGMTFLVVVALFPFLWKSPLNNFAFVFRNMARFRWDSEMLYMGDIYLASKVPWHYLPVWIALTTPLPFLLLMLSGCVHGGGIILRNRQWLWGNVKEMIELSYIALAIGPLLVVMLMQSLVYDGWRQLYFVYPAFVLVALGGFVALYRALKNTRLWRLGLLVTIALTLCANAVWMVRAHPLQNVYFNVLAGKHWKDKFDLDYWGLANRDAVQYVLAHESDQHITFRAISRTPLDRALLMLTASDRARVMLPSDEWAKPEFVLNNYRMNSACEGMCDLSDYDLYYQRKIGREIVVSVFKIRDRALADQITSTDQEYSADDIRQLSYRVVGRRLLGKQAEIEVKVHNDGNKPIAALSSIGKPIRLSWRFMDAAGRPTTDWNTRKDLPSDVPAHGDVTVRIRIKPESEVPGGTLQVSLVQELVFWAHDIGVAPATVTWTPLSAL